MNSKSNRIFSYDIIRIIAVFAVVMIHVSAGDVVSASVSSENFIFANIFDGLSRIGVPLFVMLSGALMLNENKDVPMKKVLKNAGIFFILLCLWSVFYSLVYQIIIPLISDGPISATNFLYHAVYGHSHLWYLFMLVGLYLITPILRLFVKKKNSKYILYFILLATVFRFAVPLVNFAFDKMVGGFVTSENMVSLYVDKFHLGFLGEYVTYYLIGWYISNVDIKKKIRVCLYLLGMLGAVITVVGNQIFSTNADKLHGVFYSETSINVMLYSIAAFLFIFYLFKEKEAGRFTPVITKLSNLTFGTYLIHIVVLKLVSMLVNIEIIFIEMLVIWFITTTVSFAISYIISKIPLIKKLIKC